MKTQEQVMRSVLRKRRHLVVWQWAWHPQIYRVGQVINKIGAEGLGMGVFAVRGRTSKNDFLSQNRLMRKIEPERWTGRLSFSAYARECKSMEVVFWKVTPTRRRG